MLIHADGFNIYGSNPDRLLDRVYSDLVSCTLPTSNPRTGARHLRYNARANNSGLRRALGFPRSVVGTGSAFYIPDLPTNNQDIAFCQFRTGGNANMLTLGISSTGRIQARAGGRGGTLIGQSEQIIRAGAYQHIEARWERGVVNGSLEVRVNGRTRLNLIDIDTTNGLDQDCEQIFYGLGGLPKTGAPDYVDMDDLFIWDDQGDTNNDFIGDKKCYTRFPNADGAENDWTPISGSNRFAMLDNVPPQDASEYIYAVGNQSFNERQTVQLANFPAEIVAVAGVVTYTRLWKTDAGDAGVQVGLISGASEAQGAEHALDQSPGYYQDVFEVDPATSSPWTLGALNAMLASLERTL